MAYTFFPKTVQELEQQLRTSGYTDRARVEYVSLFGYLRKKFPDLETPINLDKSKKKSCNVSRYIQEDISIPKIKSDLKLRELSLKFGNGSSGNRGAANRGNLFESQFDKSLNAWWSGDSTVNSTFSSALQHLNKTYRLTKADKLWTEVMGGENTRRPLVFNGKDITLENPKGSGYDVGKSVTDITIYRQEKNKIEEIYLSLKVGTTTTFFNVGIKKILTREEIENNAITNKDGLALLEIFGVDPVLFCMVFNGDLKQGIQKRNTVNKERLQKLLQSGIGYGYHVIHKMNSKIISEKMDKQAMIRASQIGSSVVYYGGKTGSGKRIDIEVESPTFKFKLNMRDTQGKDGYPSRLMCDFTHK